MFGNKEMQPTIRHIELFHEANLYIPNRTVYFGGNPYDEDEVTSVNIAQIIKNLQLLEFQAPGEKINIILNSCGGSWDDGIALYDLIKSLQSPVTIIGMGKVYSMGTVIMQAGDLRILTKHTTFMIHAGSSGYSGHSDNFQAWARQEKLTNEQMIDIYYEQMKKKNSKITKQKIAKMITIDYILSAQEAVDMGFADVVMENVDKNNV